eukprot:403336791
MATTYDSLFDIGAVDIDGQVINKLGDLLFGKKCTMVVNVASQSKFAATNYASLVQLYDTYEAQGFEILAFPCNQFNKEEPWNDHEIKQHVIEKYNVAFPMFSKCKVNGQETHEVFKFLRSKTPQLVEHIHNRDNDLSNFNIKEIPGNFAKFLVDRNGHPTDVLLNEKDDPFKLEQRLRKLLGV